MSRLEAIPLIRRAMVPMLVALALVFLPSCSVLLDFDQCSTDADCGAAGMCVDGICKTAQKIEVVDYIAEDTTWTADQVYVLGGTISILPPATLTIEPGTRILGKRGAALVARAGARIVAEGTRDQPIVFTSAKPVGQRLAGDWGGVALIGKAKVNRPNFQLNIITNEESALVGGNDDTWDCGSLKYVRIEFGGSVVAGVDALNGLTLAGCGSKTKIDYVQVHQGNDDAIEIFGGTVNLRHVVLTRAHDDSLDVDLGWRGTAQFVAAQQSLVGNHGIEVDNRWEKENPEQAALSEPKTAFTIYNYTLIGDKGGDIQRALAIRAGGAGFLSHGIIMGQTTEAIDIGGQAAADRATAGDTVVQKTLFYDVGDGGSHYFPKEPETDDGSGDGADGGFDEEAYFTNPDFDNIFDVDPGIERPHDLTNPSWVPAPDHTTGSDMNPPPASEGFDPTGVYRGAFAPGAIPWTEGWTDYPQN